MSDPNTPLENIQTDAIVPPISSSNQECASIREGTWEEEPLKALPVAKLWVRICLVLVALGITLVFGIAIYLNPYQHDSNTRPAHAVAQGLGAQALATVVGPIAPVTQIAVASNVAGSDAFVHKGKARVWETHTQLGLYQCEFKRITGLPCPSCGMTTSFSLLIRGDVWNSMRANWVGTILASICLFYVPWAFASAYIARPLGINSIEWTLCRIMIVLVVLLLIRWSVVLVQMIWFS